MEVLQNISNGVAGARELILRAQALDKGDNANIIQSPFDIGLYDQNNKRLDNVESTLVEHMEEIVPATFSSLSSLRGMLEVKKLYRCNEIIVFNLILHIPMDMVWNILTVFPTPIPVGESMFTSYILPAYFAVPVPITYTIIEFEHGQLEGCKKTRKNFICPAITLQYLDPNESCLLNVISRDIDRVKNIPKQCSFKVDFKYKSFFHVMQNTEEIIFSTFTNTSSKLTCGNSSSSHIINGTGILAIPASCNLQVNGITLHSPKSTTYPANVLEVDVVDISDVQKVIIDSLQSPHPAPGLSTTLQGHVLDNRTAELIKAQSLLVNDQNGLIKELDKYGDLHDQVEDHSMRTVIWLITLSILILILIMMAATWWAVRRYKFMCCACSLVSMRPAVRDVSRSGDFNRDDSISPGEHVVELRDEVNVVGRRDDVRKFERRVTGL